MAEKLFSIVCVSSQPWRSQLPTNRQQIMLRASRRGHNVLFVETNDFIGWHLARVGRGGGAAVRRVFAGEGVAPNVTVRKALNLVPWGQRYDASNRVNAAVTARLLRPALASLPRPVVLWIYDPAAARLIGALAEDMAVYDCVDAYEEQAGDDPRRRRLVSAGDAIAAAKSRLVFVTTRTLLERQLARNSRTHLVPNVGDYEHFRSAADPDIAAADARELQRPIIGFAGNFLRSKVDFDLVKDAASARPAWTFLLVGPVPADARSQLDAVAALPNVRWIGAKSYDELPRYVAAFDVGIIPYVENEYTRSCFPLKLYEYLAAGKPVVATGLPELAGMEPDVVLARGSDAFVLAVEQALALRTPSDVARRRSLAAQNTWESRAERLVSLIHAELAA